MNIYVLSVNNKSTKLLPRSAPSWTYFYKINIITKINPFEKLPIDKNVTVIAIIIPRIPKKLPCLELSGDDKPLKARIKRTPETK